MSKLILSMTRRSLLARLAGTASALLMLTPNAPTFADAPKTDPAKPDEGAALASAVPGAAGYQPNAAQTREAMAALKGYPGAFDKARAFPLANSIEPAFVSYAPSAPARKKKAVR